MHAGTDDLGKGGHADSLKTGNAGGRAACGVMWVSMILAAGNEVSRSADGLAVLPTRLPSPERGRLKRYIYEVDAVQ